MLISTYPRSGTILLLLIFVAVFDSFGQDKRLFTKQASAETGVLFQNKVLESPELNIITYEYFYNGGGVANTAANDLAMILHEVKTLANTVNDDTMRPAILGAIEQSQNSLNELTVIKNRLLELTQNQ